MNTSLFLSHHTGNQQKINRLSAMLKKWLAIDRRIRSVERKWKHIEIYDTMEFGCPTFDSFQSIASLELLYPKQEMIDQGVPSRYVGYKDFCQPPKSPNSGAVQVFMDDPEYHLHFPSIDWQDVLQKEELTRDLQRVAKQLMALDPDNLDIKLFYESLKKLLLNYKDSQEDIFLWESALLLRDLKIVSVGKKRIAVQLVRRIKQSISLGRIRDLRQYFRKMIRTLFKNLDADHDHALLFIRLLKQNSLIIKRLLPNGHQRNYSSFRTISDRPCY